MAPAGRNLLWLLVTDPYVRRLLADWATDSESFLAQFRSEAGARLGGAGVAALVDRLRDTSPPFRANWDNHGIEGFISR